MIDIVTVVFAQEINTLRAQAQSIALYCKNLSIGHIYVVVNDSTDIQNLIDINWWQHLSTKVVIVNRDCFSRQFSHNGWVDQQILKLLAAARCASDWSMVLDAKTIFIRDIHHHALISNNQAHTGSIDIFSVFAPSKKIIEETFDIAFEKQLGPGGVPFIFYNSMVRDLISFIEQKYSKNFVEWFLEKGMVTEFMLYSGYLQHLGIRDQLYGATTAVFPCNICHSEVARFHDKMQQAKNSQTISIHRNAWNQLTVEQQQQYKNFLFDRGIRYQ